MRLLMSVLFILQMPGDYDSCIGAATRSVTLHPSIPDAPMRISDAASHYDQIPDTSRATSATE